MKKLPQFPRKKEIYAIYNEVPNYMLREEVNRFISESRRISIDRAKNVKTLLSKEWREIVIFFGFPEGYEKPDWY